MSLTRILKLNSLQRIQIKNYSEEKIAFRKPWIERPGEQASTLKMFELPTKKRKFVKKSKLPEFPTKFSLKNIQVWWQRSLIKAKSEQKKYIEERHAILGNELATAHFLVFRGGSVKFLGENEWIKKDEDEHYELPDRYDKNKIIEAIDFPNFDLTYEGLSNFKQLQALKWLSLKNNPLHDDWGVDRICAEFTRTLEFLDISDCPLLTENCLASIYKLERLKTLVVTANSKEWELSCLLLEDFKPSLKIEGIKYIHVTE